MDKDTIFYGTLKEIDERNYICNYKDIMYRIINFNDTFFFAEEIATGCIFPIYYINEPTDKEEQFDYNVFGFNNHHSLLKIGKHYVLMPLKEKENSLFKYEIDEDALKKTKTEIVNEKQANTYIQSKREYTQWLRELEKKEKENKYICDLSLIKQKIKDLNNQKLIEELFFDNLTPEYVNYIPPINLKPLEAYGQDLSTKNEVTNIIGREKEIESIVKIVGIKGKSALLIGEPGAGKTAIVEKIAQDIKNGKLKHLNGKVIFSLNPLSIISGARYRGDFEAKMKEIVEYCKRNKEQIILFIDEIHVLKGLGANEESPLDALNILKPALSSGEISIIGATTKKEYEKHIAKDPAFARRIELVEISVPNKEMTIKIILSYIKELEKKYRITINLDKTKLSQLANHIFDITDGKCAYIAGNLKITNPTLSKNILENIFVNAIYNERTIIEETDIKETIKEANNLSLEFISEFGYNLSTQEDLCNLIGREEEIEKIVKAIGIEGNSVLLIGESGTGKTAIVEKLALDIKEGKCKFLKDKIIFYLNVESLNSGATYRGDFEERINKLITICKKYNHKIILFIDEIHKLYGLGRTTESANDAMNILKPALSKGEITIITATTKDEYLKYIAKDPAFARRIELIEIEPLNEETKINILISYANHLEKKYNIKMNINQIPTYQIMKYIIEITDIKYQSDKDIVKTENPTISKRLLDEIFSDAIYHNQKEVTIDNISHAILNKSQLPIEFRKICVDTLIEYINNEINQEEKDIVNYAKKKRVLTCNNKKVGFV